jgi:hypothetical protein
MFQALLAALPAIAGIGGAMGGAAKGRADARLAESNLVTARDGQQLGAEGMRLNAGQTAANAKNQGLLERALLQLKQREYGDSAPLGRYQQAILGNLAQNMQDVQIGGLPRGVTPVQFSGGMRPSAIGPGGRAAGAELAQQAMARLMGGDQFEDVPYTELPTQLNWRQSALPKAGLLDKILGMGGFAGAMAGGVQSGLPQRPTERSSLPGVPIVEDFPKPPTASPTRAADLLSLNLRAALNPNQARA